MSLIRKSTNDGCMKWVKVTSLGAHFVNSEGELRLKVINFVGSENQMLANPDLILKKIGREKYSLCKVLSNRWEGLKYGRGNKIENRLIVSKFQAKFLFDQKLLNVNSSIRHFLINSISHSERMILDSGGKLTVLSSLSLRVRPCVNGTHQDEEDEEDMELGVSSTPAEPTLTTTPLSPPLQQHQQHASPVPVPATPVLFFSPRSTGEQYDNDILSRALVMSSIPQQGTPITPVEEGENENEIVLPNLERPPILSPSILNAMFGNLSSPQSSTTPSHSSLALAASSSPSPVNSPSRSSTPPILNESVSDEIDAVVASIIATSAIPAPVPTMSASPTPSPVPATPTPAFSFQANSPSWAVVPSPRPPSSVSFPNINERERERGAEREVNQYENVYCQINADTLNFNDLVNLDNTRFQQLISNRTGNFTVNFHSSPSSSSSASSSEIYKHSVVVNVSGGTHIHHHTHNYFYYNRNNGENRAGGREGGE